MKVWSKDFWADMSLKIFTCKPRFTIKTIKRIFSAILENMVSLVSRIHFIGTVPTLATSLLVN